MHEDYALLLSFDSDDPEFTRGFEAGRVWQELVICTRAYHDGVPRAEEPCEHNATVHFTNAEMMIRIAENTEHQLIARDTDDVVWLEARFFADRRENPGEVDFA